MLFKEMFQFIAEHLRTTLPMLPKAQSPRMDSRGSVLHQ
jgi:hypothetical protein